MELNDGACRILAGLLEARTGQKLGEDRRWRIGTALTGLLRERGLAGLDQLIAAMLAGRDPSLADAVVDALLNNETCFFRDRTAFELLRTGALDRLHRARAAEKRLDIWCAGCSTGQEAYSLAMAFAEGGARWRGWKISIFATDVSGAAISRARQGLYSQFEVQRGLSVLQMMRWFKEAGGSNWQVAQELRRAVRFEIHNLVEPPPQTARFDLILCRNVLLYLTGETRQRVFARLAEAARPDASLMLGAGETVIGDTDAFIPDPACRGLYLRHAAAPATLRRAG